MYNDWLTIGPLTVHGYGVMIAIGILAAFYVSGKRAKKYGLDANVTDNLIWVGLLTGYFCSKLTYVLINIPAFLSDPIAVLGSGGWVVYGGIIGGILGAYLYCRRKKLPFMDYLNLLVPQIALAQGFGRIGCFFAGCCYGIRTNSHLSVIFPAGSLALPGVPLVPTQLISSAGDFLIFLILIRIAQNPKTRHSTGAWYLILYSAGRFLIEFLRGDIERGTIGMFSTSQFIAIFVLLAGVILLVRENNRKAVIK